MTSTPNKLSNDGPPDRQPDRQPDIPHERAPKSDSRKGFARISVGAEGFGLAPFVDLRTYHEPGYEAGGSRLKMLVWWLVQSVFFPLSPHFAHGPRRWLLRQFGAKIGEGVRIRPTARFTYPWNVEIGEHSWVGDDAVFYSLARIRVGAHCVISQKSYLCTGSHDITDTRFGLMTGEIAIENGAWIATDCFIGPAVSIGANAVVGARSSVFQSMPEGQICVGTPCRPVKPRPMDFSL
ncbi:MAG: WcaF family extracellular polysaccharide biosynthesis acetyltransferase [Cyanobacteria bacterium J06627_32]